MIQISIRVWDNVTKRERERKNIVMQHFLNTCVIKILTERKVWKRSCGRQVVRSSVETKMHLEREEAEREAGDTVADLVVGSCSFLRRIAVEEAGKMISY